MRRIFFYALPSAIGLGVLLSLTNLSTLFTGPVETTPVQAQTKLEAPGVMTVERLEAVLQEESLDLQGGTGQWQLTVEDQSVLVLADTAHNRMRIMTPVVPVDTLSGQQIQAMLEANFHSALDARYAVTGDTVVSVFVHPLSSLQEADLRSGLRQVATLAGTFGSSYSSGELGFGPNDQSGQGTPSEAGELEI